MNLGLITATSATADPEDTGQEVSPRHLTSVDALRGIAAIYVVCFHVVLVPNPHLYVPAWVGPLLLAGGSGVGLFFVVSAFTLSISWFSRRDGEHPVRNFYIRRLFRIVPLFYVLLVVTVIRDWRVWHQFHSLAQIALSVGMLFNLAPGSGTGIVWASWTIGVEMLFYLMFPMVVVLASSKARIASCFLATLVVAALFYELVQRSSLSASDKFAYTSTGLLMHLPVFILGLVAYSMFSSRWFRQVRGRRIGAALIAVGLSIHLVLAYGGISKGIPGMGLTPLAWVPLVLGLTVYPVKPIVNIVTRFYGKISYSVYLNHPIVVVFLLSSYARVYRHVHQPLLALSICLVGTFSLLTPLAYLTYRFIEQPGIRMGSRLIKRISRPAAGSA